MTLVINTRVSRFLLGVAAGLFSGGVATANAAYLSGSCCADLEERIAELEATTARKGARSVSFTISGWVDEAIFFWNDGVEQNVYVGTNSLEQSRFKFVGEAKIVDGWSAGYNLEIGVSSDPSGNFTQNSPSAGGISVRTVRKSNWFLKNKELGKLTVGLEGEATYHLLDDDDRPDLPWCCFHRG